MFAKFIIYGNDSIMLNELVSDGEGNKARPSVPYESHMFEADRMTYRKVRIKDREHHYSVMKNLFFLEVLSTLPETIVSDENTEEVNYEAIVLTLKDAIGAPIKNYYAAADSVLYIMNNAGKTIDKLAIRNNH